MIKLTNDEVSEIMKTGVVDGHILTRHFAESIQHRLLNKINDYLRTVKCNIATQKETETNSRMYKMVEDMQEYIAGGGE